MTEFHRGLLADKMIGESFQAMNGGGLGCYRQLELGKKSRVPDWVECLAYVWRDNRNIFEIQDLHLLLREKQQHVQR